MSTKVYDEWTDVAGASYRVAQAPHEPPRLEIWGHEVAVSFGSAIKPLDLDDQRGEWHETDRIDDVEAALARLAELLAEAAP